jgi:hypothetical protein
LIPGT